MKKLIGHLLIVLLVMVFTHLLGGPVWAGWLGGMIIANQMFPSEP